MEVLSCCAPFISLPTSSLKSSGSPAKPVTCSIINIVRTNNSVFRRKPDGTMWDLFKHNMNVCRPLYKINLQSRCKVTRNIVIRSELAGTGSPHAAYPLPEFQLGSKVRGICFYAVTAVAAIFLVVLMFVAHPFVSVFDRYRRKVHHLVAKIWATLTVLPFLKVEFEGLENLPPPETPAVYVSNHQSFLDIYTLLLLGRSFKFISKTGIFLFPVVGWAMFLLGTIPLKRMDSKSQLVLVLLSSPLMLVQQYVYEIIK